MTKIIQNWKMLSAISAGIILVFTIGIATNLETAEAGDGGGETDGDAGCVHG